MEDKDLPFIIQIDSSWYFHKNPKIDSDEYLGESIDAKPIIERIKKMYPGMRFWVKTLYRCYIVEPDNSSQSN